MLPAPPRCTRNSHCFARTFSNKPHTKSVAQPWTPNPNSSTPIVTAGAEGPLQKGEHKPNPWRFNEFHIVTHTVTRVLPKTARPHPRMYHQHITSPGCRVPEKGPVVIANPTCCQKLVQQSAASTSKSAQGSGYPKPLNLFFPCSSSLNPETSPNSTPYSPWGWHLRCSSRFPCFRVLSKKLLQAPDNTVKAEL